MAQGHDAVEMKTDRTAARHDSPAGVEEHHQPGARLAALADGESLLYGALDSDDTRVMIESLGRLGIARRARSGVGNPPRRRLRGSAAGPNRPISTWPTAARPQISHGDALAGAWHLSARRLAADAPAADRRSARCAAATRGRRARASRPAAVRPWSFAAADCAAAGPPSPARFPASFSAGCSWPPPGADADVELIVEGSLVSRPYIDMTLAVMASFGASVRSEEPLRFVVPAPQRYRGRALRDRARRLGGELLLRRRGHHAGRGDRRRAFTRAACRATSLSANVWRGWAATCDMRRTTSPSSAGRCTASTST